LPKRLTAPFFQLDVEKGKCQSPRCARQAAHRRRTLVGDRTKQWLISQELGSKLVHHERVGWHSALRTQVAMKRLAG